MKTKFHRSTLALAILSLLSEEPMHPYRIQQLIKERGKDEVINVHQRASLYQMINSLHKAGLISIRETEREEKWPERTIYQVTRLGQETVITWMHEMLSTPYNEYPEFPAAIAHLPLLTPQDARVHLERRAWLLEQELIRIDSELKTFSGTLPRLFLLETEYIRSMTHTELIWVRSIIEDLNIGELTWNYDWPSLTTPPSDDKQNIAPDNKTS
jgi:DNA-binding PadR family transcriptional regulator